MPQTSSQMFPLSGSHGNTFVSSTKAPNPRQEISSLLTSGVNPLSRFWRSFLEFSISSLKAKEWNWMNYYKGNSFDLHEKTQIVFTLVVSHQDSSREGAAASWRWTSSNFSHMNHFSDPNAEKPENVRSVNPLKNWLTWCQSCRHGGHSDHIIDWFKLVIKICF